MKGVETFGTALIASLGLVDTMQWPACRDMSLAQAQMFLDQYLSMLKAVPFAIRVYSATFTELVTLSPVLALSVILTGGSSDRKFQTQADNLFRHVLADQVIVRGQTSLELLQSLLTYMTWYHHRFDLDTHQFYQFLQLANGMVADLGLAKKFSKAGEIVYGRQENLNELRAFLLCYYLNCGAGVLGFDRPENMRCIDSLRSAAKILAEQSLGRQDREAHGLVELLYIVTNHHRDQSTLAPSQPAADALTTWGTAYATSDMSTTLESSFHFVVAYTLLKSSSSNGPSVEDVQVCVHHFGHLISDIVDQGVGATYLIQIGLVEWGHLITTLFLLARLEHCAGNQAAVSASKCYQSRLDHYVSCFRALAKELASDAEKDASNRAPHLLNWLERILVGVEERAASWEASSQGRNAVEIGHEGSAYELVNSFLDEEDHRDPPRDNPRVFTRGTRQTIGEGFWSEFMSDWLKWKWKKIGVLLHNLKQDPTIQFFPDGNVLDADGKELFWIRRTPVGK